jgi:hypothetical protein
MSITTADDRCRSPRRIQVEGRVHEIETVGPSLHGHVFRSCEGTHVYRVLPVDRAGIERRYALDAAMRMEAPPGVLLPDRQFQSEGGSDFLVRYPLPAGSRPLPDVLHGDAPQSRVRALVAVLRTFDLWERAVPDPLTPLPADVVIGADGNARFLFVPFDRLAGPEDVFAAPALGMFLAPELVRSRRDIDWQSSRTWGAIRRFSVGVMLASCFRSLPESDSAETVLARAATGRMADQSSRRSDFPPWLERFALFRQFETLSRRLISPLPAARLEVPLDQVASRLEQCAEFCDPLRAAAQLRDQAKPAESLQLIKDVLPLIGPMAFGRRQHYELLLLAGELCSQLLSMPLEAIDYYDRALAIDPADLAARRAQFQLIARARSHPLLAGQMARSTVSAEQIDLKLWRDYESLNADGLPEPQQRALGLEAAQYLVWRGQFDRAVEFIHPLLFDRAGRYMWWDFDLNFGYIEAFIGQQDGNRAFEQLELVRTGLLKVKQNQTIPQDTILLYGDRVAQLERVIHEMRNGPSGSRRIS